MFRNFFSPRRAPALTAAKLANNRQFCNWRKSAKADVAKKNAPGPPTTGLGAYDFASLGSSYRYLLWLRPLCSGEPTWTMAQRKPMSSRLSRSSSARRVPGLSQYARSRQPPPL